MFDKNGCCLFFNFICYLIFDFWKNFNFLDIVVVLVFCFIILIEGGLDWDLDFVRKVYVIVGIFDNVKIYYYKKFLDLDIWKNVEYLFEGLDCNEYFWMVNVDGFNYYFKLELVVFWLRKLLEERWNIIEI